MTERMRVFYHAGIAFVFALTAKDRGFRPYGRSVGLLKKVLDEVSRKLTQKQIERVCREIESFSSGAAMSAFDYMDHIAAAMEIARRGRDKKINSWLALAATNVPEDIDEENA